MSDDRLADLATADFSIWLHDLSRAPAQRRPAELVNDRHVVGAASEPTMFATL